MRTGPVFHLSATDGIDSLFMLLLDELGSLDTKEDLQLAILQFHKASSLERAKMIADMLRSAAERKGRSGDC